VPVPTFSVNILKIRRVPTHLNVTKKLNREVYEKLNLYIDRLRGLLYEGARRGCIRDDIDHGAAALLLFGMIQGLVNIWALGNYSFDLSDKFDALWDIYKKAIRSRKPSDPA
jgi:hypothetical protein